MSFNVTSIGLPKWPAMVVRGERVTVEQAQEILVRTDGWHVSTNDKAWERQVREAVGLPIDPWRKDERETFADVQSRWDLVEIFKKSIGVLPLEYLGNSQIASCYIGGPHGWCAWSGRIGCDNYNIGEWPGADTVLEEWSTIAAAFPFLRLTCQLFNGETCEEGTRPLVEYFVAEGKAVARAPSDRTMEPSNKDVEGSIAALALGIPGRERGCTVEQLKEAVARVRSTREKTGDPR